MKQITCTECDGVFDLHSPEKRRAGGKINHCPDCAEETTPKYAGVSAGEGKMGNLEVLKFETEADKQAYMRFWKATSGMNTGKNCQMQHRAKEPNVKFATVARFTGNKNHKGKE